MAARDVAANPAKKKAPLPPWGVSRSDWQAADPEVRHEVEESTIRRLRHRWEKPRAIAAGSKASLRSQTRSLWKPLERDREGLQGRAALVSRAVKVSR
jgi:hypothetical protein